MPCQGSWDSPFKELHSPSPFAALSSSPAIRRGMALLAVKAVAVRKLASEGSCAYWTWCGLPAPGHTAVSTC